MEKGFNFKNIPDILNISGSSTVSKKSFVVSSPYGNAASIKTNSTSVNNTPQIKNYYSPSTGLTKKYNINVNDKRDLTPIQKRKKIDINNYSCSFCSESLHNVFEGEKLIDLSCGHVLHTECCKELLLYSNENFDNLPTISMMQNKIVCPSCNLETTFIDSSFVTNILNSKYLDIYDDIVNPNDEMANIMTNLNNFQSPSVPNLIDISTNNFNDSLNEENYTLTNDDNDQLIYKSEKVNNILDKTPTDTESPITPQNQIGINFWNKDETYESDNEKSLNIVESPLENLKFEKLQNSYDIELAKVAFAPEFSSINVNDENNSNLRCVINFSTTEFENSLEMNIKAQIETQIGKNKILNNIINNFEEKIINFNSTLIDFSNIGSLILFDIIDVTIKLITYNICQVYLFESNLIILNSDGTKIILNQELDNEIFISSIFQNENSIIVNLNSIKIPSITLTSNNKFLKYKWFIILSKFSKNIKISETIPLIQTSTNGWSLIDDDEAIPKDIKIFNKLKSKGLDLPSGFLKRQILRPDSIPLVLILAIPLVNSEDYGLENNEYAESIKCIILNVLNSLSPKDKLGVVFLGNDSKSSSNLGNYYGCIGKYWDGWKILLDSIDESVISNNDDNNSNNNNRNKKKKSQWDEGIKNIETMASIGFSNSISSNGKNRNSMNKKTNTINQIVCISNDLITELKVDSPMKNQISLNERYNNDENPFLVKKCKYVEKDLSNRISDICDKFDCKFNLILLADEFQFEPFQILEMNKYLKSSISMRERNENKNDYDNKINFFIALDFDHFKQILDKEIEKLHKVTIKKLETHVKFPKYVEVKSFESPCDCISIESRRYNVEEENSYSISLKNLSSGYDKSLMFNLYLDLKEMRNYNKVEVAKSKTLIVADKLLSEFENKAEIKILSKDTNIENNFFFNLNIEKSLKHKNTDLSDDNDLSSAPLEKENSDGRNSDCLNLSIVSRLSNVSDAFFVRKKMQLLVKEGIYKAVLNVTDFDLQAKENAKVILKTLVTSIWELSNICNDSNTKNIKENNMHKWSTGLIEQLEEIIEGYSLRNYQLSNIKAVNMYLSLE